MIRKGLLRWCITALAILVAMWLVPGIEVGGQSRWLTAAAISLILGLINALIRPLLKLLTLPVVVLTLGLFALVINAFTFWLASLVGQNLGISFRVSGSGAAFGGALVVSLTSTLLGVFVHNDRRRKRQEKRHDRRSL